MRHVPLFTFPLIPSSFASNYKHPVQGWDHHKWAPMCLVDVFVCRWRVRVLNSPKTRWRNPLQMEDATCIRSCVVITHRVTINTSESRQPSSPERITSNLEGNFSLLLGEWGIFSQEASILLESEWGSFQMSGPISDEGLFIPDVVIHSTKFAERIEQMWRSDTETSEGPDYRYLLSTPLNGSSFLLNQYLIIKINYGRSKCVNIYMCQCLAGPPADPKKGTAVNIHAGAVSGWHLSDDSCHIIDSS